jgi:hypothetical protein
MARIPVTFTVDPEKEPDIARWLESLDRGEKSMEIREALRYYINRESRRTLDDVYRAVQRLERRIESGIAANGSDWDEPDDVAAAIDNLGRF